MARALAHTRLGASDLALLGRAGLRDVGDITERFADADDLARLLEVPVEHARRIIAGVGRSPAEPARTARELLGDRPIITFCQTLDQALGGGVHPRRVTEFCGSAGLGKTQFCLQLCVDVQIPREAHGVGGTAIYVDAEGSFAPERLRQIAGEMVTHVQKLSAKPQASQGFKAAAAELSVENVLRNVRVFRATDHVEFMATVDHLFELLTGDHGVKLVVFDSVAAHLRSMFGEPGVRSRLLARLAAQLAELARTRNLAVVITNQMTTIFDDSEASSLVPALGETWSHAADARVLLARSRDARHATVIKAPTTPIAAAGYVIDHRGVRDLPRSSSSSINASSKRPRAG